LRLKRARLRGVTIVAIIPRSSGSNVPRTGHSIAGSTRISNRRLHYLAMYLSVFQQSSSRPKMYPTCDVDISEVAFKVRKNNYLA